MVCAGLAAIMLAGSASIAAANTSAAANSGGSAADATRAAETARVGDEGLSAAELARLRAGLQLTTPGSGISGADPILGYLPDLRGVDMASWLARARERSKVAAASAARQRAKANHSSSGATLTYREKEPANRLGRNDTTWAGERVNAFGLGPGRANAMVVRGTLAELAPPLRTLPTPAEDNGSIESAAATGIRGNARVRVSGVIGDGPYGRTSGDFDWYQVRAKAGETVTAALANNRRGMIVILWNADGQVLDFGLHVPDLPEADRVAAYLAPKDETIYVQVLDSITWQLDPHDSGSGTGAAPKSPYSLEIGSYLRDRDAVLVRLRRGDVLGTSVAGGANRVSIQRWDSQYVGGLADADLSMYYPPSSPLPGGGNAVAAYVAEADGWYGVIVERGTGAYRNTVEVYRPGGERSAATQTIYLDFDGAVVNPAIFGGEPGRAKLSGLKSFLSGWGLKQSDLPALAAQITKTATENLQADLRKQTIPNLQVKVVNGLTGPDLFGRPNVSRVVVGGTIDESGLPTVGIANVIDPGNFSSTDQALVLLDMLSAPVKGNGSAVVSLNYYIRPRTDKIAFIGTAIGNVVSHEAGHYIGNFHTENSNGVTSLMDAGGQGFWRMFQAGPDRIGGTADDGDTDFTTDRFALMEGFRGIENTANLSAWAFSAAP